MERRRVKIICEEGISFYLKLVDADTGELIHHVESIEILPMDGEHPEIRARVVFSQVPIEITADAEIIANHAITI